MKEMVIKKSGLVSPGDVVVTKTFMGELKFTITRVTKTLAIARVKNAAREFVDIKFKRQISHNMSHPYEQFCLTEYRVEARNDSSNDED